MSDTLLFFVPVDEKYTFADVVDELSCTYCTVHNWQLHSQDESGWWYAINIYWDNTTSETVALLQSAIFMGSAYIYVGHCVNSNKSIFHDVNIFCPRIYDYANLYSHHAELLEIHSEVIEELNSVRNINVEIDRDNVDLKTNIEEIKKKNIDEYDDICRKYNIKSLKYKQVKKDNKTLNRELTQLHEHNRQLFDTFPQHCS